MYGIYFASDLNYGDVRMGWTVGETKPEENPEEKVSEFKLIKMEETEENVDPDSQKSHITARQNAFFKMGKYFYSMFEVLQKYRKTGKQQWCNKKPFSFNAD